jgi:hypothetical protein
MAQFIMNDNQKKRLNSLSHQRFYLLNIEKKPDSFILSISGSSRNIYKVTVNEVEKTIHCDCPDQRSWAKTYNCACKHCCFVMFKVCKDTITETSDFFTNLKFNDEDFEKLGTKLMEKFMFFNSHQFLQQTDGVDETIDLQLLDKFQQIHIGEEEKTFEPTKELQTDDQCPICFVQFEDEEEKVGCPECKNTLHKDCMEQWLKSGNQTCVFCRSKCWSTYFQEGMEGEYINLGY